MGKNTRDRDLYSMIFSIFFYVFLYLYMNTFFATVTLSSLLYQLDIYCDKDRSSQKIAVENAILCFEIYMPCLGKMHLF